MKHIEYTVDVSFRVESVLEEDVLRDFSEWLQELLDRNSSSDLGPPHGIGRVFKVGEILSDQ